MTVSLRQTKKFLTRHKLLMTLRARDIFKISHASLLLSPRFDRDLFPSFLADNFQRIDARQHFVRDRQPFGERFAHWLGAVEAGLGRYVALGRAGIERRSVHSRQQYQPAIRLEASCQGQKHFALVEYVHVLVKHEGMLDIEEAAERRHRRGLALSLHGLAYLDVDMRHPAPDIGTCTALMPGTLCFTNSRTAPSFVRLLIQWVWPTM